MLHLVGLSFGCCFLLVFFSALFFCLLHSPEVELLCSLSPFFERVATPWKGKGGLVSATHLLAWADLRSVWPELVPGVFCNLGLAGQLYHGGGMGQHTRLLLVDNLWGNQVLARFSWELGWNFRKRCLGPSQLWLVRKSLWLVFLSCSAPKASTKVHRCFWFSFCPW